MCGGVEVEWPAYICMYRSRVLFDGPPAYSKLSGTNRTHVCIAVTRTDSINISHHSADIGRG